MEVCTGVESLHLFKTLMCTILFKIWHDYSFEKERTTDERKGGIKFGNFTVQPWLTRQQRRSAGTAFASSNSYRCTQSITGLALFQNQNVQKP